jgi:hypothetical protein
VFSDRLYQCWLVVRWRLVTRLLVLPHDIRNAQAWYYPEDKVLVLWECFLHDFTHDAPLLKDTNMSQLWAGFEKWLLDRYPETEKIITPYADPIWDIKESLVSEGTRV